MTVREAIEFADGIKPNAFDTDTKVRWLNDAEGMVQTQVLLFAVDALIRYDPDTDMDFEMLVRPPHDKLYWAYLVAMIDFANGEYNKYDNSMRMFNGYFGEFMRWYAVTYRPADGLR